MFFRRKFSKTMYKNRKLMLGEMSFSKDFINTDRGDLYPLLTSKKSVSTEDSVSVDGSVEVQESVSENRYHMEGKTVLRRLLGQHFPYATYEMKFDSLEGYGGFCISAKDAEASILLENTDTLSLIFSCGERKEKADPNEIFSKGMSLIVSCRKGAFDIYLKKNCSTKYITSFRAEEFDSIHNYAVFSASTAAVEFCGKAVISEVTFYMDCGISQADIRPIRYENGDVMLENGRIFFTMSIRLEERCYQGIFSWIPGTAEFELTGTLFFDAGDNCWENDVASSILYNRKNGMWYLWVCSFSHDHILGYSAFPGDVRFGVNVVDITLMKKAEKKDPLTAFRGFSGDEDPDFFYDETTGHWYMAICRLDPAIGAYRYHFFESDQPFENYKYIGCGQDGAETGGSFVRINDEICFCCGNSFELRANYRLYSKSHGMQNLRCDYDDGGFRGWGTIVPVTLGSRTRYFWLTFDRHNGSEFNWSYGNVYCFEASSD